MTDAPPRVGFVGAGFHARTNLIPATKLAGVQITALVTRDVERSMTAVRDFALPARPYGSVASMLGDCADLDRFIVSAQPSDQGDIVKELIEAGRHVLVEKPLGRDGAEASELAGLAAQHGVALRVAFMKRHAPAVRRLRRMIDSSEFGAMMAFDVRFAANAASFATSPDEFVTLAAIHHVDLVGHLVGDIEDVYSRMATRDGGYEIISAITTRSGCVGTLRLGDHRSYTSEVDRVELLFEEAAVTMTDTREIAIVRPGSDDWRHLGASRETLLAPISTMSGGAQDLYLRGFVDEIADFATADLSDADAGAHDNVATMSLRDRVLELGATPR